MVWKRRRGALRDAGASGRQEGSEVARGLRRRVFAAAVVVGVAVAALGVGMAGAYAASSTATLKYSNTWASYGSYRTHYYKLTGDTGTYYAYCAQPNKSSPSRGSYTRQSLSKISSLSSTQQDYLAAIIYFGYGGPGFDKSMWPSKDSGGNTMNAEDYYTATHVMVSLIYNESVSTALYKTSSSYSKWAKTNITGSSYGSWGTSTVVGKIIAAYKAGEVPGSFIDACYMINYGKSGQTIVGYDWDGSGDLLLSKSVEGSSDTTTDFYLKVSVTKRDGTALTGSYAATRTRLNGVTVSMTVTFSSGSATVRIRAGQTVRIEGLPNGASYTVSEPWLPDGYTCSSPKTASCEGTISSDGEQTVAFTNAYEATGSWTPTVRKYLDGSTNISGSYEVVMVETDASWNALSDGLEQSVTLTSGANPLSFPALSYGYEDIGSHYYLFYEVVPGGSTVMADGAYLCDGVIYDDTVYQVTVTVSDNGDGTLAVEASDAEGTSYIASALAFYNERTASLAIQKSVEGTVTASAATVFSFDVELFETEDGSALAGSFQVSVYDSLSTFDETTLASGPEEVELDSDGCMSVSLAAGQTAVIDEIPSGTGYRVSEVDAPAGYELVESLNASGVVSSTSTVVAEFVNEYEPPAVKLSFAATKQFDGGESAALQAGAFTFSLSEEGSATPLLTAVNDADGVVAFGEISYTIADVGSHVYTVAEVMPSGATAENGYTYQGVTYDTTTYTLYVEVQDAGDGTLTVTARDADGNLLEDEVAMGSYLVFSNGYDASGSWAANAVKVLEDGDISEHYEEFTFELARVSAPDAEGEVIEDGLVLADGSGSATTVTAACSKSGLIECPELAFDLSDVGSGSATYYYRLSELVPEDATDNGDGTFTDPDTGVIYLGQVIYYTVVLKDDGQGGIACTESCVRCDAAGEVLAANEPVIENESGAGSLKIIKYLEDASSFDAAAWFTFMVVLEGEDVNDELVDAFVYEQEVDYGESLASALTE